MRQTEMINGVDVGRLNETIDAINQDPGIALFRFRATNHWDSGGFNTTTIHDFYGAKQHVEHDHDFHISADEPEMLLGKDLGANPVEIVLSALAGCLTTSLVYHAAARGITIRGVESELEGELDLRGFLGLSDQVRNGYRSISVTMRVDADAPPESLEELVRMAKARSPVTDIISNPVDVMVTAKPLKPTTH